MQQLHILDDGGGRGIFETDWSNSYIGQRYFRNRLNQLNIVQRCGLQTLWTLWRWGHGGPVWGWPWRFVSSLAFLFWLSQRPIYYPKYILWVAWRNDQNHVLLLIDLFPPKDDLLPHVTGGFRGRAITVGSLEYDPWMKFVRSVESRNLRRGIMTRFSGTARATWSDIPASSLSCSKRFNWSLYFRYQFLLFDQDSSQSHDLYWIVRWASSWTSPMLSESLRMVSGGWWGGASGTASSGEITNKQQHSKKTYKKCNTHVMVRGSSWYFTRITTFYFLPFFFLDALAFRFSVPYYGW